MLDLVGPTDMGSKSHHATSTPAVAKNSIVAVQGGLSVMKCGFHLKRLRWFAP